MCDVFVVALDRCAMKRKKVIDIRHLAVADCAKEAVELARTQIIWQAATAILAHANVQAKPDPT